ncbi:MAG: UDP-N-acetylmuramoyl-L-alanine--D-glutamate ligase [Cytophagales bacterium]|nr:UDP-N-acetylmuramoyl-L-alanine--D-glutamate ligase [Cytophagales bacterium]
MQKDLVVVLGAGESGVGAGLLAQAKGFEVFVSDFGEISEVFQEELLSNNIPFEQGKHTEEKILSARAIVKSPGIPDTVSIVQKALEKGIEIISEIEFASRFTNAFFIAITGSNGKTTTTLLTYHLLKEAGLNVGIAGNVGYSLAKQVIEDKHEYYVLELSSFQLDNMYAFKANIAVLLNITPDHLDRYEYKLENYIASKYRILQNMTSDDVFISYREDKIVNETLPQITPNHLAISLKEQGEELNIQANNKEYTFSKDIIHLKGEHNLINSLVAMSVALTLNIDKSKIVEALASFENAPHRLQEVAEIDGIRYINDSKATNVDAVKYALGSVPKGTIWIAGGVDKGNDYTEIEELVKEKVEGLVCLGTDNSALVSFFGEQVAQISEADSMKEAIEQATRMAQGKQCVLLSPACASFDLFKSYIDRGDQFIEQVNYMK